jgi:hypothetical protein
MKNRSPNQPSAKMTGKPLPTRFRSVQAGILFIQPTLADKAKIALGYGIRIRVHQRFQHNPGVIDMSSDWEVVPQQADKTMPKVAPITQEGAKKE